MPWSTPTLSHVRALVRDAIRGQLPGADANVPNSVLRVLSDNQGALCHLTLQYVDWLALQLMVDTAETEWLDRHGYIWLINADGSVGRKLATPSVGTASFIGQVAGSIVPQGTQLIYNEIEFETLEQITASDSPTPARIISVDPGSVSNLSPGTELAVSFPPPGIANVATVIELSGGTDQETDVQLRARVLERIREPPMGGDAGDYVNWALRVPGVTRAWSYALEMGIGTVTVRFMMDDLRASNGGFPLPSDVDTVRAYLDSVRPVAVKDFFVVAPIPYPVNLDITYLDSDDAATRAAITESLLEVFLERASPGQKWYRAWTDEGIAAAAGVNAYDLVADDVVMPDAGYMPVLGDITYGR